MLPFFSATAEPFALKLGMVFWNGTGKTAKHFGVHWMRNYQLSHNSCMKKGSQYATLRNDETNVWRHQWQCVGFIAMQLTSCNYILSDVRDSGSVSNGLHCMWLWRNISFAKKGHRESGISQRTHWYLHRVAGTHWEWAGNSLYWPVKNERGTDTGVIVVSGKNRNHLCFLYTGVRNSIMFLRYEYAHCRGLLLKMINH